MSNPTPRAKRNDICQQRVKADPTFTRDLVCKGSQTAVEGGAKEVRSGAGFASTLIADDLVDEYQFYVNPVALGEGLSIFKECGIDSNLELREAEGFACGIVVICYRARDRAAVEAKE